MGWDVDRLALLTEADTAYGQGAAGKADPPWAPISLIRFPEQDLGGPQRLGAERQGRA